MIKSQLIDRTPIVFGLISWISIVIIIITSYEWFRRKKFELFYYTHFLFFAFLFFGKSRNFLEFSFDTFSAFLHSEDNFPFIIIGLIIYAFDKLFQFIWGSFPSRTLLLKCKDEKSGVIQIQFKKHLMAKYLKVKSKKNKKNKKIIKNNNLSKTRK